MERELLLEIGCEEIPASWLPSLTNQVGDVLAAQLTDRRLPPETAVETYSSPRRLTVRIARIPERQTDLEELVNGPPVTASFAADGTPTPAATGFAAKQGVDVSALEHCLKCSHMFNILDASNSIGVTERTAYILRVRQLAVGIAKHYVEDSTGKAVA